MKKAVLVSSFFLLVSVFSQKASASTIINNVQSSANGSNANSNVSIENNVNTGSQNTSNSTTHTDIRIETNGEVKEYHSDKPEDIKIESSNGSSKVEVHNNSATVTTNTTSNMTQNETNNQTTNQTGNETDTEDAKKGQLDIMKFVEEQLKSMSEFFLKLF